LFELLGACYDITNSKRHFVYKPARGHIITSLSGNKFQTNAGFTKHGPRGRLQCRPIDGGENFFANACVTLTKSAGFGKFMKTTVKKLP